MSLFLVRVLVLLLPVLISRGFRLVRPGLYVYGGPAHFATHKSGFQRAASPTDEAGWMFNEDLPLEVRKALFNNKLAMAQKNADVAVAVAEAKKAVDYPECADKG